MLKMTDKATLYAKTMHKAAYLAFVSWMRQPTHNTTQKLEAIMSGCLCPLSKHAAFALRCYDSGTMGYNEVRDHVIRAIVNRDLLVEE